MSERSEKLLQEALALSAEERTRLAAAWSAEIDRRAAKVEDGRGDGEPWEAIQERLRSSLKK